MGAGRSPLFSYTPLLTNADTGPTGALPRKKLIARDPVFLEKLSHFLSISFAFYLLLWYN